MTNRRWLLRRRPEGHLERGDFELVEAEAPRPGPGQLLVRNIYCSLDPAMRRWLDENSYAGPMSLGDVVRCVAIGEVIESDAPGFAPGDKVIAMNALEDYSVTTPGGFTRRIDPAANVPLPMHLSLFGPIGMTAYVSLTELGKPKPGETVLVSGAAGAVGSLVGQIARNLGCRVVGVAGGPVKCERLLEEFGFDAAIDYKGKDLAALTAAIAETCPEGVDIYYDNVGGIVLDAALANINHFARLVECGMISGYNATEPMPGPTNLWNLIARTATMSGFLGRHFTDKFPEAVAALRRWHAEGRITARAHVDVGLESFPDSMQRLFTGDHDGKLMLRIDGGTD
ncbi:MAG: NADP-dependent oxidoreductase [Sphingomonadales bacterium]